MRWSICNAVVKSLIGSLILFPKVKRKVSEIYGIADPAAVDEQSAEVQQISKQLLDHAVRMFLDYLRKTRHSRRKNSSGSQSSSVGKDTAKDKFIDQVGSLVVCVSGAGLNLDDRPSIPVCAKYLPNRARWKSC
jgi:hypothetical protein